MIQMNQTCLSKIATVSAGQAAPKKDEFSDYGIPFIRAGSLDSLLSGRKESDLELVSEEISSLRRLKIYPKGTVVFAKSGMSATKDRIYVLKNPAYVVSHLATLIPNDNVNADYLCLVLKRFPPSTLIKDPAYPSISLRDIQNYEIPVPEEFDDQIRIAHLLKKVERLITQRKQHLKQLDELLNSIFLKMFGDPVRNEMKWDKKIFGDLLINIDSGESPKCEARSASENEWGVLKLGAVTKCIYNELENKALPNNVPPSIRNEVKAGDLLFSRKNTYELVAACAYVFTTRPKLLMPDLIFRFVFRDDSGVNPIYIWKLLTAESQRKSIQSMAGGAAGSMPNISKTNLKKVLLPIPPLPLQDRFAVIVKKIEDIKSYYQKSLTDLESLYGTLSQKAFKGELDLSKIKPPTQRITVSATEEQLLVSTATTIKQLPTINLSNPNCPAEELYAKDGLRKLIIKWVETYCTQLASEAFSIERFMTAVQNRLTELYPDNEFEIGANEYEYIKEWVFLELEANRLQQSRNSDSNMIELRAVQS